MKGEHPDRRARRLDNSSGVKGAVGVAVVPVTPARSPTEEAETCAPRWVGCVVLFRSIYFGCHRRETRRILWRFSKLNLHTTTDSDGMYRLKQSTFAGLYRPYNLYYARMSLISYPCSRRAHRARTRCRAIE